MTGSNRRPPACKAGALPAELILLGKSAISFALLRQLHSLTQSRTGVRSFVLSIVSLFYSLLPLLPKVFFASYYQSEIFDLKW